MGDCVDYYAGEEPEDTDSQGPEDEEFDDIEEEGEEGEEESDGALEEGTMS